MVRRLDRAAAPRMTDLRKVLPRPITYVQLGLFFSFFWVDFRTNIINPEREKLQGKIMKSFPVLPFSLFPF